MRKSSFAASSRRAPAGLRPEGAALPARAEAGGRAARHRQFASGRQKNTGAAGFQVNAFVYRDQQLCADAVPLTRIAEQFGTPCYVYSRAAIEEAYRAYDQALARRDHLICYAVKANSSLAILNVLARLGSGFDIVSGGELERVIKAGGDPRKIVFSGVGKSASEIRAALTAGILCFNVESGSELKRLDRIAGEAGKTAPVSLRVNPDVDAKTHPYIATGLKENKFGVAFEDALPLYRTRRRDGELYVLKASTAISVRNSSICRPSLPHCKNCLAWSTGWLRNEYRSNISTSAAGSASAIATRRRRRSSITCGR